MHRPLGCCRHPFAAVDSLGATATLRLEARKRGKKTEAIMGIMSSALTYDGATRSPLGLALCYIAHYSVALDIPPPPDTGH